MKPRNARIISHLKASYLNGFITKDEKNEVFVFTHGKTEEILFEFVSVFETLCVHCQVWLAVLKWKVSIPQIRTS